jgi:SAM-dependent methyltransferase
MRKHLRRFIDVVNKNIPIVQPIYEFGSLQVSSSPDVEDLRSLFPGAEYVGCDMQEGPGVDRVMNLHQLDLPDSSVGTVICMDTMEHVEYPRKAMAEIHRILQPGGMVIMSSVMDFPIHGYPHDYWRFTPEGFKSLLNIFENNFVGFDGPEDKPITIVGLGFKGVQPPIDSFMADYLEWQRRSNLIYQKLNSGAVL